LPQVMDTLRPCGEFSKEAATGAMAANPPLCA
jgi:hypothetical protein